MFLEMCVGSLILSTAGSDFLYSWEHGTKLYCSINFFPHPLTDDSLSHIQTSSQTAAPTSKINNKNITSYHTQEEA
jgi:hypothetical protein